MVHADYSNVSGLSKEETLQHVLTSYEALEIDNWVSNLSNLSSLLWHAYHSLSINVNWTGFYVLNPKNDQELVLGPFQGKVACQTILFKKGVCGTAADTKQTQVVPDVHSHPSHIACDSETNSEIVIPIIKNDQCVGVIDLDCLDLNGFDHVDQEYLEKLAILIAKTI